MIEAAGIRMAQDQQVLDRLRFLGLTFIRSTADHQRLVLSTLALIVA
jgi:hypothetical protein